MILVVDDDKNIRLSLKLVLERNGYEVALAENPKEAIQVIRTVPAVNLVLMDMNYSLSTDGEESLTLLKQIKVFRPEVPCILMTAWGTIDLAVQGMRAEAFDFITKPWDNGVLLDRIETALKLSSMPKLQANGNSDKTPTPRNTKSEKGRYGIIGDSPYLMNVLDTVARVAPTNAPVLITGESGTGKELIAEAIHKQSRRASGPFVKVNLGGISTSLFESEMFGHKKGSFTDATADRIGRFELAKGGTIFLDEIGELSLASQVKLLRVLQDQTYEVLGDSHTRTADVRVICATNADLRAMVGEHTFREDLFYRINLINLHLPPLRERREDIPLLVEHFLREACAVNGIMPTTVSAEAIAYLQTLPFTGNIRELKNLVERALLMKNPEKNILNVEDFQTLAASSSGMVNGGERGSLTSDSCIGTDGVSLSSLERNAIAACIAKHNGNLSLVAKELGISRGALYRKIEKHGL
ncbi:MAG: sigma-54-dependent Fis family transcriptional regulator [Prevotella sp.]|nr:sigma-54-dependent Fis family transcriptional regulator [Prevotella sp.]